MIGCGSVGAQARVPGTTPTGRAWTRPPASSNRTSTSSTSIGEPSVRAKNRIVGCRRPTQTAGDVIEPPAATRSEASPSEAWLEWGWFSATTAALEVPTPQPPRRRSRPERGRLRGVRPAQEGPLQLLGVARRCAGDQRSGFGAPGGGEEQGDDEGRQKPGAQTDVSPMSRRSGCRGVAVDHDAAAAVARVAGSRLVGGSGVVGVARRGGRGGV